MSSPSRPATSTPALPTVVGPTENALRLLLHQVLAPTDIAGYEEWVVLNVASALASHASESHASESHTDAGASPVDGGATAVEELDTRVADALKVDRTHVRSLRAAVTDRELLDATGRLTQAGAGLLAHARRLVSEVTGRLVAGISEDDLRTATAVLDTVRMRAEEELRC